MYNIGNIDSIRDRGRTHIIVAADFNIKPSEWNEYDYLEQLDATIIVPEGIGGTCRTANGGSSLIDFLIVSKPIALLIKQVKPNTQVP